MAASLRHTSALTAVFTLYQTWVCKYFLINVLQLGHLGDFATRDLPALLAIIPIHDFQLNQNIVENIQVIFLCETSSSSIAATGLIMRESML